MKKIDIRELERAVDGASTRLSSEPQRFTQQGDHATLARSRGASTAEVRP
jgi:hypothetical protein